MVGIVTTGDARVRSFTGDLRPETITPPAQGGRRRAPARWAIALAVSVILTASLGALVNDTVMREGSEGIRAKTSYTVHAPISILFDSGFTLANGVTGGNGTASDPFVIQGWEINATEEGMGIQVSWTTAHYVIRNVHVYGEGTVGVALAYAPNGTVEESLFDRGDYGVRILNSQDCNVTGNTFSNLMELATLAAMSQRVNFTGNLFEGNNLSDITGAYCGNLSVTDNICVGNNLSGILLYRVDHTHAQGNQVVDHGYAGMWLDECREVVVAENHIENNARIGLAVNNSISISVFHNRFIGNDIGAIVGNSTDISWDAGYPMGGNYWSDYDGVDECSGPDQDQPGTDGMGDSPYITEGGGIDRYPWMTPDMVFIPEFGAVLVPALIVVCALLIVMYRRRLLSSERR